jgi:hypothetical protein
VLDELYIDGKQRDTLRNLSQPASWKLISYKCYASSIKIRHDSMEEARGISWRST